MTNRLAIIVATIHAGDNSRAVFGPFANGDEASRWGFKTFPDNTIVQGRTSYLVTWCWEYIAAPEDNAFDFIVSSIN